MSVLRPYYPGTPPRAWKDAAPDAMVHPSRRARRRARFILRKPNRRSGFTARLKPYPFEAIPEPT